MRVFNILNLDNCKRGFDLMRDPEVAGLKCKVALSLMYLTGIYKINTKTDLKSFIYRSVLLFVHTDMPAYYFENDRLFRMDDYSNYWTESDFYDFFGARSQIKIPNLKNSEWQKEIDVQFNDSNKKRVFEWFGLFYLDFFEKKNKKKYSASHFDSDEKIKQKTNKILAKSIVLTLFVSILTVTPLVYLDLYLKNQSALVYWTWMIFFYILVVAFEFYLLFLIALKLVQELQQVLRLNSYPSDLLSIPAFRIENILARTALEIPDPELEVLGIDSFKHISKNNLFVITLLYKGKIVLTNFILKYLLVLFVGEKIFGVSILYEAVLVECFWNLLVIRKVMIDARLRLFGFKLSHEIINQFNLSERKQQLSEDAQRGCLRAIGNSIVITKNYHPNMIFLLVHFQKELEVNEPDQFDDWKLFIETLSKVTPEERFFLLDLFSVATAFDGSISSLEKKQMKQLFGDSFPKYIVRIEKLIYLLKKGHFYKALNECHLDFSEG